MKKGWTKVDPAACSVPAGACRSAARYLALSPVSFPPGGAVVVVAGVDDELQAASRDPAATRPTTKNRFVLRCGVRAV